MLMVCLGDGMAALLRASCLHQTSSRDWAERWRWLMPDVPAALLMGGWRDNEALFPFAACFI